MARPKRVHSACGMISPKNSTAVTEMPMAAAGDTTRSRKMGSASMQMALASSRVTNSRWCRLTSGSSFRARSFSLGGPLLMSTLSVVVSMDTRPMVSPDIMPAVSTRKMLMPTAIQNGASVGDSGGSYSTYSRPLSHSKTWSAVSLQCTSTVSAAQRAHAAMLLW